MTKKTKNTGKDNITNAIIENNGDGLIEQKALAPKQFWDVETTLKEVLIERTSYNSTTSDGLKKYYSLIKNDGQAVQSLLDTVYFIAHPKYMADLGKADLLPPYPSINKIDNEYPYDLRASMVHQYEREQALIVGIAAIINEDYEYLIKWRDKTSYPNRRKDVYKRIINSKYKAAFDFINTFYKNNNQQAEKIYSELTAYKL